MLRGTRTPALLRRPRAAGDPLECTGGCAGRSSSTTYATKSPLASDLPRPCRSFSPISPYAIPVLLPTTITVDVASAPSDDDLDIIQGVRGGKTEWRVRLPRVETRAPDTYHTINTQTVGAAETVILAASDLPDDQLKQILDKSVSSGLMDNTLFGMPIDVVLPDPPDDIPRDNAIVDNVSPEPHPLLALPTRPGPGFTTSIAEGHVTYRCQHIPPLLPATLPALRADPTFRQTLNALRASGWLDWQLLVAVHNIALNERIGARHFDTTEEQVEAFRAEIRDAETPDDPVPVAAYTAERLTSALETSLASAIVNHWHLVVRAGPVDIEGVRTLLDTRFSYSPTDTPHEDPFA